MEVHPGSGLHVSRQLFFRNLALNENPAFDAARRPEILSREDSSNVQQAAEEYRQSDQVADGYLQGDTEGDFLIEEERQEDQRPLSKSKPVKNIATTDPKTKQDPMYKGMVQLNLDVFEKLISHQSIAFIGQVNLRKEE